MKIEGLGHIKGIEQIHITGQASVKLTDGEILVAKIEQIQGEKLMLRNREGALFMALMQGELGLAQGDTVEVAASGKGDGYVLYLLDIDKEASNQQKHPALRDNLPETMAMMKATPGLDPKSAAFLTENNIPNTPENIAALSELVRGGSGLGALLAEILQGLSRDGEVKQPLPNAGTGGMQPEGTTVTNSADPQTAKSAGTERANTAGTAETSAAAAAQGTAQTGAGDIITAASQAPNSPADANAQIVSASGQEAAPQPPVSTQDASIIAQGAGQQTEGVSSGNAQGQDSAANEQPLRGETLLYNKEQIKEKILEIFIRPDEQTGAQLKKTVMETSDKLNALKMMLNNSDKSNKEIYIGKAAQAQKQLDMMSDSKRFDYIQMPFYLKNGAERTAELYVFRRKRKKEPGEEGMSVLVALDTQNIGRVETLIKTSGTGISLEFRIEHKELQQEISKRAKILAAALEGAGYHLKNIRVTKLKTRTTVLNAAGPDEDDGAKSGKLDVKI